MLLGSAQGGMSPVVDYSDKAETPARHQLLEQIEVLAVIRQDRETSLQRGQENQGVVQRILALVWLKP
jgi:hypothetical protein